MAQKKTFFEQPIDRTPYTACIWVALIVAAIFCLLAIGIWKVSGMVGKSVFSGSLLPESNGNLLDQAKDAVKNRADQEAAAAQQRLNDELNKQKDAAVESATEAIKQEAQNQIDQQVDKQKEQLQQFLP